MMRLTNTCWKSHVYPCADFVQLDSRPDLQQGVLEEITGLYAVCAACLVMMHQGEKVHASASFTFEYNSFLLEE